MKRLLIYMFILLITPVREIKSETIGVEDLLGKVRTNLNAIDNLRGKIEVRHIIAGKEMRHTIEVLYKKPNKFKIVSISSTGIILMNVVSDGENLYSQFNILDRDDKIRKEKIDKRIEYFIFQMSYYTNFNLISEIIHTRNNIEIIKQTGSIYKIELDSGREGEKDEVWIDYEKGIITRFKIIQASKISAEVKEIKGYGNIYFPVDIKNENMTNKIDIVTEIKWEYIEINKAIEEKEFKME